MRAFAALFQAMSSRRLLHDHKEVHHLPSKVANIGKRLCVPSFPRWVLSLYQGTLDTHRNDVAPPAPVELSGWSRLHELQGKRIALRRAATGANLRLVAFG